jgi:hypothetical protein
LEDPNWVTGIQEPPFIHGITWYNLVIGEHLLSGRILQVLQVAYVEIHEC